MTTQRHLGPGLAHARTPLDVRVLITAGEDDPHVRSVTRELDRRGAGWTRIDTAALPEAPLTYAPGEGAARAGDVDLTPFNAVWYRRSYDPILPTVPTEVLPFARQEFRELFQGALFSLQAHWVDHPVSIRVANSKPYQLHVARSVGLPIPPTLITSDPAAAGEFLERHGVGSVIAKGIGLPTLQHQGQPKGYYTCRVDERAAERLSDLRFGPCILQSFVPKAFEARVTVVGNQVFAARIDTPGVEGAEVDWRLAVSYRDIPHSPIRPPAPVWRACLRLCRRLALRYGALDFIIDPEGCWHFLEINPSGQWAWIEEMTGMQIGAAIADELCRGATRPRRRLTTRRPARA